MASDAQTIIRSSLTLKNKLVPVDHIGSSTLPAAAAPTIWYMKAIPIAAGASFASVPLTFSIEQGESFPDKTYWAGREDPK